MRSLLIQGHRDEWPTRLMGQVPEVSPGGSDAWRRRPAPASQRRRGVLIAEIKAIHHELKARYRSPRIHAEWVARGRSGSLNTPARPISLEGVAAKAGPKSRCTTDSTHDHPIAENVVDRRSEPGAANQTGTADISYIPTREGGLYPAAVEDLHWRRILGRSMSDRVDSRPVVDASEMAVSRRLPGEGLVGPSERGSQYAGEHDRRILAGHGITCGMSRRANSWDDAPMESFLASPKKELVHDEDHATRGEARASLLEYIEVFDNRIRRHSSLGYRSPAEYERAG